MPLPGFSLPVVIRPDEHGFYDGREVARQLIRTAFQSLVAYVNDCPACADNLFSAIANEALTELHEQRREEGMFDGKIWTTREAEAAAELDEAAGNRAAESHFEAARAETRALLGKQEAQGHQHH